MIKFIEELSPLAENETEREKSEFIQAIRKNDIEEMKRLLKLYNIDVRFSKDWPLRIAADAGHLELVKFFVDKGGDIQANDNFALRWSVLGLHVNVVRYLIKEGAAVQVLDESILGVLKVRDTYPYEMTSYLKPILLKEKRLECLKKI